jgi:hypothetical protein
VPIRFRFARTLLSLFAAVSASAALLTAPPNQPTSAEPVSAGLAWPNAQRGSVPADLPDGSVYTPAWFVDARTSIGTARSADGGTLRLVVRNADGSLRLLRLLAARERPSVSAVAVSGDVVVWAEGHGGQSWQVWTAGLRGTGPARLVTADTGHADFYQSEYDLVVAGGRVHWVASGPAGTEVRSVALGGGAVQVTTAAGQWQLSAWPWLVDGVTSASGTAVRKNLVTGRDEAVSPNRRAVTNCGPAWCRVVSLTEDGDTRIDLMRPNGTSRRKVAQGLVETVVADVGALDRFEIYADTGGNADLTGNVKLLVYDVTGRRTILVSPDAADVTYRAGVLWWSTGTKELFLRHSLDLRTV